MSTKNLLEQVRLVDDGPTLRERLLRRIAEESPVVARLSQFRENLERDMAPEPWTELQGPMVLLLADVCDALQLNERERATVLGEVGERTLADYLESRSIVPAKSRLNERQTKALAHARNRGSINLGTYRRLCPDLSDETLRRDLVDLAQHGLLARNGRTKGTRYTLAA